MVVRSFVLPSVLPFVPSSVLKERSSTVRDPVQEPSSHQAVQKPAHMVSWMIFDEEEEEEVVDDEAFHQCMVLQVSQERPSASVHFPSPRSAQPVARYLPALARSPKVKSGSR